VAEEEIRLASGAIATSAPLGTTLDAAGAVGHILDPVRGIVPSPWRRITVLHRSATIADGLSTGLALTPPERVRGVLDRQGSCRVIAVDNLGRRVDMSA
jgi:thiamine biosynthesis lipoprotein